MGNLKLLSSLLAVVGLVVLSIEAYALAYPCRDAPCPVSPFCSTVRDIIWATDGATCLVFRNGCFLANEICERVNRHDKRLKPVTEGRCKELCAGPCTRELNPQCAIYADRNVTYANPCVLRRETCSQADPPLIVLNSTCSDLADV